MATAFLHDFSLRPLRVQGSTPFKFVGLALGRGNAPLEVVVATHRAIPPLTALRSAWKARNAGRAAPLLFVVLYDDKAALCGPAGDDPPARIGLDPGQVERICREALEQPDRHAAQRALRDSLPAVESELAGVRNHGFLATHELKAGAPQRKDWSDAHERGKRALSHRGEPLLRSLGYTIEQCDSVTSILRSGDRKAALAVLLNPAESADIHVDRFAGLSPISYALAVADRENLPYVVVCQGAKIRLYPTKLGLGVGGRGRTETYVECHTGLLRDSDAAYLWLLFSAEALAENGSLTQLLDESHRFAGSLAENLRDRIYEHVVPRLATGIATSRGMRKPSAKDLTDTYEMAMMVLFRLLFIAYAEDKDLLPYQWNGLYQRRSLKTKAQEILDLVRQDASFDESDSLWEEVSRLFRAIENGNREWDVPEYNGGLFSSDSEVSPTGQMLTRISLPNTVFGPVLRDLLLIQTQEGLGPVDFRALGVREFGTIYEGLLESELSVAETSLTVNKKGLYRPARKQESLLVEKGEIYLHNRSGARKATGTYFTKSFAVEHLLDRALVPALQDHLERISKLDKDEVSRQFFDFRVADIAMGSGHFLVAAVDRIEKAFAGYLAKRPLPGVRAELATLRTSAWEALASRAEQVEIEDTQLLRRLIARRCIYGVDINPVAVQLARLAIWIHTFVPGLPLSFLDHNLVCGNSLVGIGQLDEVREKAEEEHNFDLFRLDAVTLLGEAAKPLNRLAQMADLTAADIERARRVSQEAGEAIAPAKALCDITTACRINGERLTLNDDQQFDWQSIKQSIAGSKSHRRALKDIAQLNPLHFPIAFPEVFLRKRSGFDVILGNPPWKEATLEEDAFWARNFPGMRSLPQREQETLKAQYSKERPDLQTLYERELAQAESMRKALVCGVYPGMGTGDPDVYKAFCWRFWHLIAEESGRIGVVVPRSALSAKGSTQFRQEVFFQSSNTGITALLNSKGWVFDESEHRYTIGLVSIDRKWASEPLVSLEGPYPNRQRFEIGRTKAPISFTAKEITSWNDTASLPLLPNDESVEVFAQLRKSPRLDLNDGNMWRARPHTELHATNDKALMDLQSKDCPKGFWPVYKGKSFDTWNPDRGTYYAWADPDVVLPLLQQKRLRSGRNKRSAFSEFRQEWLRDPKTMPCLYPRVAFRDITNRTNQRTVLAALIPANVFITNKGPYFLFPRGNHTDEAYLLGVLASIPLDWYARRFVEECLNFFILNPFPIPRSPANNALCRRVVELAGRLACPDDRFADWAEAVGVKCGPLPDDEKDDKIHELDAVVAHLYGLKEKHLIHIFETFHEGWDYADRLKATVAHFRAWKKRL